MDELISVIIPCYDVEPYLETCIKSVQNQTYQNLEILLVDDDSPDRCGEIGETYAREDSRIKVLHKENGGLSSARNAGIRRAAGTYIAFLDSDDYIDVDMIETLYKNIKACHCGIAVCEYHIVGKQTAPEGRDVVTELTVLQQEQAIAELVKGNIRSYAWNKLFRRSLFDHIRFPEGSVYEDIFIMHRLFAESGGVVWIPNRAYYYVQRSGSIMHTWSVKSASDNYWAVKARLEYLRERYPQFQEELKAELIRKMMYLFLTAVKVGRIEKSDRLLLRRAEQDFKHLTVTGQTLSCLSANERVKYRVFQNSKKLYQLSMKLFFEKPGRNRLEHRIAKLQAPKKSYDRSDRPCVWFIGLPEYNNLGDCAIGYGAQKFLAEAVSGFDLKWVTEREFRLYKNEVFRGMRTEDVIVLQGGGNIGNLYRDQQEIRRLVISKRKQNKIIIFPQTVYFTEDEAGKKALEETRKCYKEHLNLLLVTRESYSYEYAKEKFPGLRVMLLPDMAFWLRPKKECGSGVRRGILICIRNDVESALREEFLPELKKLCLGMTEDIRYTDTVVSEAVLKEQYEEKISRKLREFSAAQLVVTDRLHGVIFAALTKTPCIAVENSNYKIRGICGWLKEQKNIVLCKNIGEVEEGLARIRKHPESTFSLDVLRQKLMLLAMEFGKEEEKEWKNGQKREDETVY